MDVRRRETSIRIGVSACLLGQPVRYDGGDKYDVWVAKILAERFTLVPVCPEVEIGLGIPRETLRLVRDGGDLRLVASRSGADHSATMRRYAARRVRALGRLGLCGYVLKSNSPSCGLVGVPLHDRDGRLAGGGRGLFADELMRRLPSLPVEDEKHLQDPALRENFVTRVLAYERLRRLFRARWTVGQLTRFHAAEKPLLTAHAPALERRLRRLVGRAPALPRAHVKSRYEGTFMLALTRPAQPEGRTEVER
jgi:uncharacterized protein YbbK (DUF523 family)